MKLKNIMDGQGAVRGRLDEGGNSTLNVYNRQGRCLGYYHQIQDKTYSVTGRFVGNGDQRLVLLAEETP